LRLLVATHVLLWFMGEPESLAHEARNSIIDADVVLVSAASLWEISTKVARGRLRIPSEDIPAEIEGWGFATLPITGAHAWAAGTLPPHHRDPFDRMLVAQAQLEGLTIVTRDTAISKYQVAVMPA